MTIVHVKQDRNHMATTFEFTVSCENARAALADRLLDQAHALVDRLERELSEFLPESPVFKLNTLPAGTRVEMPPPLRELLERSQELREITQDAFNSEIKGSAQARTLRSFQWDLTHAWKTREEAHLGFGAIGKGYALDQVRMLLERNGFHDFLLCAGGSSLLFSGFAGPQTPWKFAWSWKKDAQGRPLGIPLEHASGSAISLGISGSQEKGSHILGIDGDRNGPTLESALIAHTSAAHADALSTALFVSGWERALGWIAKLPLAPAAAAIDKDGSPRWTGGFQKSFGALAGFAISCAFLAWSCASAFADEGDAVDLGEMGLNSFTPYVFDRSRWWMLLPAFAIGWTLLHLKKPRRTVMKNKPRNTALIATLALWSALELISQPARAVEVEPMGNMIKALLGTPKAFKKTVNVNGHDETLFYSKGANGKPNHVAFIEKGIFPPSCTHTWGVGIDAVSGKVTQVRVNEMSCPHAFPAKAASFLDQYKGKGPADVAKLDGDVQTIAKATGSCKLTTDAVKRSITAWSKIRGQF